MAGTGTWNMVGIRSGSNDPSVVPAFGQLLRIVLTHVVGSVLPRQWQIRLVEFDIGFEALRQIGAHHAPVIHLYIDVMPIASRPRGKVILTPGALQVGGQALFTRAGNQQVTAILKHQLFQPSVCLTVFILLQQKVRRVGRRR